MIDDLSVPDFVETSEKVARALGSNWDFKTFKGIFFEIMKVMQDPHASAKDLARIISQDQGLSSRTLRIVNSPYYGLPNKVNDLTRAIALLGFDLMKKIALSISVFETFPPRSKLSLIRLWRNGLGVARMSELLARQANRLSAEAYTVGLLHHIGKYLLCSSNEEKYFEIQELRKRSSCSDVQAEKLLVDVDHTEIGFVVAKQWGLPPMVQQVIVWHHTELMGDKLDDSQYLAQVVMLADEICSHIGLGIEEAPVLIQPVSILEKIPKPRYEILGMNDDSLLSVLAQGKPLMDEVDGMLKLLYF